ncbi:MAG: T9SS type A sorting domain-containing protein [Phycisphaerae bacterium]|nr:T9SS type A sorting domain-containing protein [Saprospiraceae bacterium]
MKKSLLLVLVMMAWLLLPILLFSQQKPSVPFVTPDAPKWMQMLVEEHPNVFQIQKAYADYYENHAFEKNSYTQYFKHWMRWARPFVQSDGFVKEPTVKEMEEQEKAMLALRSKELQGRGSSGWTFLGPKQTYDTDGLTEVTWQTNVYSIDISLSNPNILYAGGESGGVWKTTDKGLHWQLLTVNVLHGSFGAVKIHPTDPNTVYAATSGKIIKTTDGGTTWATTYSESGLWVNDVAFKPDQPNIVLAASDQGLLRTTNAGTNWTKLHTQQTWAVEFKPGDPLTVFVIRKSGTGSDFRVSTDGGASFVNSNAGWWTPAAGMSVTGGMIAVCPSNPSKVYAYLCGEGGNLGGYIGVFKSTNSGGTWSNTNPNNTVGQPYTIPDHTNLMDANGVDWFTQGFYDMAIIVNPSNDNQLIAGGCSWFKSLNGGQTWTALGSYVGGLSWSHPDIQAIAALGNDLWITSDGGINYSTNFAQTIEARMNGISGSDMWGFDSGWNEDVLVGGRYHNGNMAWHESFPDGKFYRMGGAEAATGYVNPGDARKTYHSDIGGYRLKGGFLDGVSYFPVGLFPHETYAYYGNSEMAWDPRCWNIVYLGNENKIWKSTDGGTSYTALYAFPGTADNTVFEIEVSRSNPDVIYCSQWDGTDDSMWKTTNGGQTWTKLTSLPLPNNNDRVKMALSGENENVLWVAVSYGSDGKKIYKTTNGGQTWTNLTTAVLNNITITNIMAQYGTDGGVYLGTSRGIFYRNNTLTDWQPYNQGLPLSAETNKLKPFYKNGKIRNGCWGFGVWEADLYEPSAVVVQPMASTLAANCARDTIYFDDYSVLNHSGASWEWSFSPAPVWSSATNIRNPKAVFGGTGTYNATLTVNGQYSKSLSISIGDGCRADTIPGSAVNLNGNNSEDYVALAALNLNTNTLTITAWIKPDGIQPEYSAIFMHDGATAGFNFLPGNNHLGYHWPNGQWWWDSGLTAPDGEWSHVAMVVEPTGVTLYVNGRGSKQSFTPDVVNFDSGSRLGNYKGWGGRFVKGSMDEVCIFNKSLTQNEIRELMHLTKAPEEFPNLISYYQFNEANGLVLDRVGVRHGSLVGPTVKREKSTAPVGKGVSKRLNIAPGHKRYTFDDTGLTLVFPLTGTYPNGEVVVSRLSVPPDTIPNVVHSKSTDYWILQNYGTNATFVAPAEIWFLKIGAMPADLPASACKLWKRGPVAHGPTWQNLDAADVLKEGPNALLGFTSNNQLKSAGQFWLELPGLVEARKVPATLAAGFANGQNLNNQQGIPAAKAAGTVTDDFCVFPNPVAESGSLQLRSAVSGNCTFRLYDAKGNQVRVLKFEREAALSLAGLAAGAYGYRIENEGEMRFGQVVVGK